MKIFLLSIVVLAAATAIVIWQWNNPTQIIALGSILGASFSSIALTYSILLHSKTSKKEAKLTFIDLLPHTKVVLAKDVERAISSCAGTSDFNARHKNFVFEPEKYMAIILNNEVILNSLTAEYGSDNVVLHAALETLKDRYDTLKIEATKLDAEFYFELLVGELGFDSFYRKFWEL